LDVKRDAVASLRKPAAHFALLGHFLAGLERVRPHFSAQAAMVETVEG
jgi:hypothetical protein